MNPIDELFNKIETAALAALESVGRDEHQNLHEDLDTPIEYHQGLAPVRSMPGEPPRRGVKSAPLQQSLAHEVSRGEKLARLTVSVGPVIDAHGRDYAFDLEFGAGPKDAPRPFMRPSMYRIASSPLPEEFARILKTTRFTPPGT